MNDLSVANLPALLLCSSALTYTKGKGRCGRAYFENGFAFVQVLQEKIIVRVIWDIVLWSLCWSSQTFADKWGRFLLRLPSRALKTSTRESSLEVENTNNRERSFMKKKNDLMNHWNQDSIPDNSTPMSCNLVVADTIFQIAETFPSRNQRKDKIKIFIDNSFRKNVHLGIGYWSLGWEGWKSKLIQRAQVNSLSLWMQLIVHCVCIWHQNLRLYKATTLHYKQTDGSTTIVWAENKKTCSGPI